MRQLLILFTFWVATGCAAQRRSPRLPEQHAIFELIGPDRTTGLYTVRRYELRGNSILWTTSGDIRLATEMRGGR